MKTGGRGFTLIELLVIVAILATMVTIGVGSIRSGQGAARVKGATRDIFAAIRHARSTALVTGQPAIITYSNDMDNGEVVARIEITSAKLFNGSIDLSQVQTLSGEPLKGAKRDMVIIEDATDNVLDGKDAGETIEDILFAPMDTEVVKGMRLKVVKGDEAEVTIRKSRISVFSNVDFLLGKFSASKMAEANSKKNEADEMEKPGDDEEMQTPVSVVWETNGRVDPHRVWVYADGQKPEDGLMIKIDQFGAAKVVSGDGGEED